MKIFKKKLRFPNKGKFKTVGKLALKTALTLVPGVAQAKGVSRLVSLIPFGSAQNAVEQQNSELGADGLTKNQVQLVKWGVIALIIVLVAIGAIEVDEIIALIMAM
jgi:hypothetical protein